MSGRENEKLFIIRGEPRGPQAWFDESKRLELPFNPTEYSIDNRSVYSEAAIPGLDAPLFQYNHGEARSLSMELLIDTYTYGSQKDVRQEYIDKLESLLLIDGALHAPPPCKVVWGSLEFIGLLQELRKRYVLFLEDGTPVRARVNMTWKEYLPLVTQLRRTLRSSPDRRKTCQLKEGASLWQIAYEEYGHVKYWKLLADTNDIDNPLELQPGHELVIPPLDKRMEGSDVSY